ncbi:hypothetical protein V5O48_008106 [Marasmius crinis-equi]|uniref:Uncharacterized protein n=1 Tax=Marasmius crinis-equi TaxID=585013 RepID=A0ABR3FET2_9AGAR
MLPPVTAVVVLGLSTLSQATSLQIRASVQSSATCDSKFSWMNNKQNLSPCFLAAALTGPCLQGDFNISPLQPNSHYDPPTQSKGTATRCLCSWAAYNLYSACTACQNEVGILPWPSFRQDCPDNFISKDTLVFLLFQDVHLLTLGLDTGHQISRSQGIILSLSIPEPIDQRFDVNQARNISEQQRADLTGQPASSATASSDDKKSKTPTGAIVGGVVGGLAAVIGAVLAFWLIRRKRAPKFKGVQELDPGYHRQSLSEAQMGHKSVPNHSVSYTGSIYPTSASPPPETTGSPTVYTHNESMQSFSQFGAASAYTTPHSVPPSRYVQSPAPTMLTTVQNPAPEDIIQPFIFNQSQSQPSDSHSNGPTAPPRKGDLVVLNGNQRIAGPAVNRDESEDEDGPTSPNPPAYTQYPAASETSSVAAARREQRGHGHRPPQDRNGHSTDTLQTSVSSPSPWTSFGSGGVDSSMASSTVPFGIAAGEFGQMHTSTPPRPPMHQQATSSRRSILGRDEDDHVEVA